MKNGAGNYERMLSANTGLGEAGKGSEFPAPSDGGFMPDIIETAGALLQARSPQNPQHMGPRFAVPSRPQTNL